MAVGGLGPGADVEHLVGAGPSEVASLYVADRVATRLPGGESDRGQLPHHLRYLGQLHEVELQVLPGGDMAPASAVFGGDGGQGVELVGGDGPVRDLDPHHLAGAALALTVDAVVESKDPEDVLGDPSG